MRIGGRSEGVCGHDDAFHGHGGETLVVVDQDTAGWARCVAGGTVHHPVQSESTVCLVGLEEVGEEWSDGVGVGGVVCAVVGVVSVGVVEM